MGVGVRVLLAEDSPIVARQLRELLAQEFDVVALVTEGDAVVPAVLGLHPDVLVTDIGLPGVDGMQAAEDALHLQPSLRVVFITVHADNELVARARSLGPSAYVLKSDAGEDLASAVRAVVEGRWFLSASLIRGMAREQ